MALNKHINKRLSSSAQQANLLFRSSPTNGTSPSSLNNRKSSFNCDSDHDTSNDHMSLEDDVFDLTQKIQSLQDQVSALTENQLNNDERYSKVKQENVHLMIKIHSLEEQLRELEIQSEEKRQEDQKRFKDVMERSERDKSKECEQYMNRIYSLQQELLDARDEARRFQSMLERMKHEKSVLEESLSGKNLEIETLSEEIIKLKDVIRRYKHEESANSSLVDALSQELTDLKTNQSLKEESSSRQRAMSSSDDIEMRLYSEFENEMKSLKDENSILKETNEELTAQLLNNQLEEGRTLLQEGTNSLANELGNLNVDQLRRALRDQQDVNLKLRAYIDGILLNIVENYPQLLEVKSK